MGWGWGGVGPTYTVVDAVVSARFDVAVLAHKQDAVAEEAGQQLGVRVDTRDVGGACERAHRRVQQRLANVLHEQKKKHRGSEKCPACSRARQDARPGTHVGNVFQQLLVDPVQPVALRRVAALVVDVRYHLVHERERSLKGCVVGVLWRWARDPIEPTDGNR